MQLQMGTSNELTINGARSLSAPGPTSGASESITLPLFNGGTHDFIVDWGIVPARPTSMPGTMQERAIPMLRLVPIRLLSPVLWGAGPLMQTRTKLWMMVVR